MASHCTRLARASLSEGEYSRMPPGEDVREQWREGRRIDPLVTIDLRRAATGEEAR